MGGCQSARKVPGSNSITPEKFPRSSSSTEKYSVKETCTPDQTRNEYRGFYENCKLLCLDQFVSRYTGEIMHRWRPATIVYSERSTGQVKIHFDGWKDKHDIWLNLKADMHRFCFIEMVTDEQIRDGLALSEAQLTAMQNYAQSGVLNPSALSPNVRKTNHVTKNKFHVGQKVDILDKFKPKDQSVVANKWRPGEVVDIQGCHLEVHYIGWGEEWNEVIDTSMELHRIKEGGSKIIPRGTNRDTYRRQIIGASPAAKQYREGTHKLPEKLVPRRRSSHSEIKENTLDSYVTNELMRKNEASKQEDVKNTGAKRQRRGMSRIRSFPPLNYDEDRHDEQLMLALYDQQEKEYYAALQQEKVFVSMLNEQKMHVVEVDGDGNCLFRAIAHQLWLDEDRHMELRRLCVAHMKKHAKRYQAFYDGDFEKYLVGMSKPGKWGDDIEIRALEEITDRLIYIYSSQSPFLEPLKTNFDEVNLLVGVTPLKISYHGKNHYNSIFDENTSLPLPMRSSRILSTARHRQLME